MQLIDSHAHIDFPQFDADRDAMLDRARAAGVTTLLAIGTGPGPEKLDAAIPYAEQHDWIYATIGIHPHEAKDVTPASPRQLAELADHPKVIAWGEIGLDYFYDHSPRDVQDRVFRDQMALAHQAKLPIIIHCRDAWPDTLTVLDEAWSPTGLGGILHCFTSTLEDAQRGLDMGFLISFAGNSTYPKAANIRDVAKALPLEKILIETDSPFLAPQGLPRQAQRARLCRRSSEGDCICEKLGRQKKWPPQPPQIFAASSSSTTKQQTASYEQVGP